MSTTDFNQQVIDEFRANSGSVGGMFEGTPLLLLHHVGARSGTERVTPLVYLQDADRWVIFASKAGAPSNPAWYHNLVAHPETRIELGSERVDVLATVAAGEERDRLYATQSAAMSNFAEYQEKTTRVIPAVVLTPRG